ncbi:MAG: carboxypeptidase-like regulatory domain-containing protein [Candidatus Paceibacterota bacterium]
MKKSRKIISLTFALFLAFLALAFSAGNFFGLTPIIVNFTQANTDTVPPFISNMAVTSDKNGAALLWNTNEPSAAEYSWGTTQSYEGGTGSDPVYSTKHRVVLSSIEQNVTYHYKVVSTDTAENSSVFIGTFVIDNESDTVAPANPSGFKASVSGDSITLTWTNPRDTDFASVKVVRSMTSYPSVPSTGNVIYEGKAQKVIDTTPAIGVKYFYSIFAKDPWENYSSGSFTSAKVAAPEPPVVTAPIAPIDPPVKAAPPPTAVPVKIATTTPTTTTNVPTAASSTVSATASSTPVSATTAPEKEKTTPAAPSVFSLSLSDFEFYSKGGAESKLILEGNSISADSNKNIRISIPLNKLPVGFRSVILKVNNIEKGKDESQYVFAVNGARSETIVDLNGESGSHAFQIEVLGNEKKVLAETRGAFILDAKPAPLPVANLLAPAQIVQVTETIEKVAPKALPIGVAVSMSQSAVLVSNIGSFYDVYLILLKCFGAILVFFGKKKPKSWGVVYDSVTKRPIDPAYVVMEDLKGEKKKSAITDINGRYGFLAEPGAYSITANKTHYKFPSQILANRKRDEMYDDLYFGEIFDSTDNAVIQFNIPLDPVEFDWNEFIKNKEHLFTQYSRKEKIRSFVFNLLFLIGFSLSVASVIFSPSIFNISIFAFYVINITFQMLWKRKHKVTVLLGKDGRPVSFAMISAELSGLSIPIVKKVTTDMLGRFYLLTQPGVYDIKVEEKQGDETYKEIYRMPEVKLDNGVLTNNIVVR